jgi:HAMP domain-containing protein
MQEVAAAILSAVAGAAAAWATTQARLKRLEEVAAELKADKASKESLDAVRGAVDRLREDLDRRFDRLEDAIRDMGKPHA